jgi:hypothetical protein
LPSRVAIAILELRLRPPARRCIRLQPTAPTCCTKETVCHLRRMKRNSHREITVYFSALWANFEVLSSSRSCMQNE